MVLGRQNICAEGRWLQRSASNPHSLAWIGLGLIVVLAWVLLALMAYGATGTQNGFAAELLASLCSVSGSSWTPIDVFLALAMWIAMTFAMMLPAGAPMLSVYLDIGYAAQEKNIPAPSPLLLISGYLLVWCGVAVIAAIVQWQISTAGWLSPTYSLASSWAGGLVLIGAGAWQFTNTKHQCLTKCRRPFTWFMANWRDDAAGVFKMGLRQGITCVTCCWALMLVMFFAGLMNLVWMAGLAIVMVLEKIVPNPRPLVYGTGAGLVALGLAVMAGLGQT